MFPAVITALAFVITFIVVGLVVVAAAFSGARRSSERPSGPSRRSRRTVGLVVGVLAVLLGVLVPALVIAAAKDSDSAPGGVELTAAEEHGREVFADRCATCHTLKAANAVGKVGPNLDQLVGGLDPKGQKAFVLSAIKEGRARGQGQMPKGLVDGQDAEDVAAFVSATAGH
jgi:mono/diheme cytochrome c family protein